MGLDKMRYPLINNKLIFKTEFFLFKKAVYLRCITTKSNDKKVF